MTTSLVRKRTVDSDQLSVCGAAIRNGWEREAYLVIKLKNFHRKLLGDVSWQKSFELL